MLVEPRRGEFGRRMGAPSPQTYSSFAQPPAYAASERIVMARWKVVLLLMISLGFLAIFSMVPPAEWSFKFWFGALIFGLAAVAFTIVLVRPTSLELDAQGFTYAGGLTPARRFAWRDIDRFFVWKPPRGGRMVAYTYAEGRRPASVMAKLNRLVGVDGSMPNLFTLKPEALAEKLEGYRRRA